jgi:hypothetical protein
VKGVLLFPVRDVRALQIDAGLPSLDILGALLAFPLAEEEVAGGDFPASAGVIRALGLGFLFEPLGFFGPHVASGPLCHTRQRMIDLQFLDAIVGADYGIPGAENSEFIA